MPFVVTQMGMDIILLSEMSQTKRQVLYDDVYMWNLKIMMIQINSFPKQTQTHRLRQGNYGYPSERGRLGVWIDMY